MPVAGNDLGGDVLPRQAECLHHPRLDRRRNRRIAADRARELADRELLERVLQPLDISLGLEGEARELQPESRWLSMDTMGPPDAEGVGELLRAGDERVAIGPRAVQDDRSGLGELQR